MRKQIFDTGRVERVSEVILAELRKAVAQDADPPSPVETAIEKSRDYNRGLTRGESALATLRALQRLQVEITDDLAAFTHAPTDDDD